MEGVPDPRKGEWIVCLFPTISEQIQTLKYDYFRLKLRALHRFSSTAAAVEDLTAVQEGKIPKALKHFLTHEVIEKGKGKEVLAVADTKLGKYCFYLGATVVHIALRQSHFEKARNRDLFKNYTRRLVGSLSRNPRADHLPP
jgi:hypothetical protein